MLPRGQAALDPQGGWTLCPHCPCSPPRGRGPERACRGYHVEGGTTWHGEATGVFDGPQHSEA